MVAVAGGDEPISVAPVLLLFGMRSLAGTMTGSATDAEDTCLPRPLRSRRRQALSCPCKESVRWSKPFRCQVLPKFTD